MSELVLSRGRAAAEPALRGQGRGRTEPEGVSAHAGHDQARARC